MDLFVDWSRRKFVNAISLVSATAAMSRWTTKAHAAAKGLQSQSRVYSQLGIRPLINAAGTYTMLSACTMSREVVAAMEDAARHHVAIAELHAAVGKRIAGLVGAEAALVTSGRGLLADPGDRSLCRGQGQRKDPAHSRHRGDEERSGDSEDAQVRI